MIFSDAGWIYQSVDCSTDSTTVYAGPCLLRGVIVSVGLSAHLVLIKDGSTTVAGLAASAAAGTNLNCYDMRLVTSLVVDPDNSSTGTITVVYKPDHGGLAGDGA